MITDYVSDRYYIGAEFANKKGCNAIIIGKSLRRDRYWVQFQDDFRHCKEVTTKRLRSRDFKNPYYRSEIRRGYYGFGVYEWKSSNKFYMKRYNAWNHMMNRCYDSKSWVKNPTYKERWINFHLSFLDIIYNFVYTIDITIKGVDLDAMNR